MELDVNPLKLVKSDSRGLILERSRFRSVMFAAFSVGFFVMWYTVLLREQLAENAPVIQLFFFIAPVLFVKGIYQTVLSAIYGEKFEFLRHAQLVRRNGRLFVTFKEVDRIQIREIRDSDGHYTYRLSLMLKDGSKRFMDSRSKRQDIYLLADEFADILDVKIVSKK